MIKLVLLRHGESIWNKKNRFTGWTDVDLTDKGIKEAKEAGKLLKNKGYTFDKAYTSVLKRATHTLDLVLETMGLIDKIPVEKSWRLNERHYGALQGLNKAETAEKHSEEQVLIWRRSYDTPPPPLDKNDERFPGNDPLYKDIDLQLLPVTECLKDTVQRFLPYWNNVIVPDIKQKKRVIITAHGNSLRALVKYLDNISNEEIVKLNIPTGIPLIYELDDQLKPIEHYYLGDLKNVQEAINEVENQGKKAN